MSNLKMSWNDRLALIDHFQPTVEQVCAAFNVTPDELETARSLKAAGTFQPTKGMDFGKFNGVFSSVAPSAEAAVAAAQTQSSNAAKFMPSEQDNSGSMTGVNLSSVATALAKPQKTGNATAYAKPETASKPVKVPQKRGRKGDKISTALAAVPTTQVSAEEFAKQHGVSLAVLRQSKRFLEALEPEQRAAIGTIKVRQDKTTKTLMIWRETGSN